MCLTKSKHSDTSIDGSLSSQVSEAFLEKYRFRRDSGSKIASEPNFLIIGAGAAGLACAVSLLKKGFRYVTIIEAENRIGGRIFTKSFGHNTIDLGAQWCHGEKGNIVYQTVSGKVTLGSSTHIYTKFDCIRSDGELLPNDVVQKLKTLLVQIFAKRHQELPSFKGTFGEYLSKNFYEMITSKEYEDISRAVAREFFENFIKIERSETAAGVEEMSAQGFENYIPCDGDYLLHFDNGFLEYLRILLEADEFGNDLGLLEDKIIFGIRVKEVTWNRADFKAQVTCENTSAVFLVDHVIVTVSLGVLKRNAAQLFNPELPISKQRAIEGIGYGSIMKLFLEFPTPFWNSKWMGLAMLWREEDLLELRESARAWLENIYGFYRVANQPCVIVGWLVGSQIPQVETMPDIEVKEGCMYLLRRFLPQCNIPDPIDFIKSVWDTNPNFYGTSSFRSLKTEELCTGAVELAQPITVLAEAPNFLVETHLQGGLAVKPVILFAGEATHETHFGTVHGAVESGIREAKRLEGYYTVDL
ncbi:PREDICTED: spermine oxidase-like [Rhagoletis zephyria]|uniref:spermine oxidase-like n=1 Tax=Rhagoletis zephyria TaxID=28612 RepID=UPI0008114FF5|nr:PREDICTED: spermine oxidase-like [Rhagoletis zephyria]